MYKKKLRNKNSVKSVAMNFRDVQNSASGYY